MAPKEVTDRNEKQVWQTPLREKLWGRARPHLKVSQQVRLTHKHRPFKKAYLPGWTKEVFIVNRVVPCPVMTYSVMEWDGTPVEGQLYEENLQAVTIPDDALFRVEKILQQRGTQVKVRWMGWPSKYDSWIPKSALTNRHQRR